MSISASGIASGLNVNEIVTQLVAAESGQLNLITKKQSDIQSRISAFGTLKSALASFQASLAALSKADKFNVQTAASSNSALFTATANGKAINGNYSISVNQLAQNQKLASAGFASKSDALGSGTLTITLGRYDEDGNSFNPDAERTPVSIAIQPGADSLEQVRDAINNANAGVTATIINDGSASGNRLVLTAKNSGSANSIKIEVSDDDGNDLDDAGLSRLAFDPTQAAGSGKNLTQVQQARDALLTIDGIDIVKSSNSISDAIEGVTLNLLATSNGTAASLDVGIDKAAIEASVAAFVKSYNDFNTTLRNLTKYDETTKTAAALNGDATTRNIAFAIKSMLTGTVNTGGSLSSLSQIGVGFQADGTLALDSVKFQEKLASNFDDIAKLFATSATASDPQIRFVGASGKTQAGTYAIQLSQLAPSLAGIINGVAATASDTTLLGAIGDPSEGLIIDVLGGASGDRGTVTYSIGFAAQLNSLISGFLDDEGILAARTDGLNSSITRLDREKEMQQTRLAAIESRYRAQFTALETMLSSMNSTSAYLTQQLTQISANTAK